MVCPFGISQMNSYIVIVFTPWCRFFVCIER